MYGETLDPIVVDCTASTAGDATLSGAAHTVQVSIKTAAVYMRFGATAAASSAFFLPASAGVFEFHPKAGTTQLSFLGTATAKAFVMETV